MKQYQIECVNVTTFKEKLEQFKLEKNLNDSTSVLFQIYSELLDTESLTELTDIIEEVIPNAEYAGCTGNGNILNGQFSDSRILVVCTVFEKPTTKVKVKQYNYTSETVDEIIADVIKESENNPWIKAIEMYLTISDISTTPLCDGLEGLRKDIQVFGGVACNENIAVEKSFVFSKGICSEKSVVFIFIGGEDFYVNSIHVTGWQPLGRKFCITKAKENILYELDGRPAYEIYQKYLNIKNDEDFFSNTLEFPLFYDHNGITILRVPTSSNADGSLTMSSNVETDSITRIAYGNPREIVDTIAIESQKIRNFVPDVLHIFSCGARKMFWNSDESAINELRPFNSIAPSVGFFTHGEFLRSKDCLNQHNVTLVIGAMREGDVKNKSQRNLQANEGDITKLNHLPVITRLATFVGVASAELEEMNKKLEDTNCELEVLNHKLEMMSTLDGLTNLYNRAEIQRRIAGSLSQIEEKPFSLIMLDIDNFKRVNDTYGHQVGDVVIVALSNILRNDIEEFAPNTFAGRWGGEEFMILLPNYNYAHAKETAEIIRKRFSQTEFLSAPTQTVSVGVTQARIGESLDNLCTRVDSALYKAKTTGKNRVVGM